MPKKKVVNYGNGLRGCFLTVIKWPVRIIGTGGVCLIVLVLLRTFLPKGEPRVQVIASAIGGVLLIQISAYVVETFLRFATAEKERGVVALNRDLRDDTTQGGK